MPTELLTSKLFIPPLRPSLVPRPRLLQLLNEGLSTKRRLTLISAPAGFGNYVIENTYPLCGIAGTGFTLIFV